MLKINARKEKIEDAHLINRKVDAWHNNRIFLGGDCAGLSSLTYVTTVLINPPESGLYIRALVAQLHQKPQYLGTGKEIQSLVLHCHILCHITNQTADGAPLQSTRFNVMIYVKGLFLIVRRSYGVKGLAYRITCNL